MHLLRLVSLTCLFLLPLFVNAVNGEAKLPQSANQLKDLLLQDPGNIAARLQLASIYRDAGEFSSAEKELLLAQRLGTPLEEVSEAILDVYIKQGKYDKITEYLAEHKTENTALQATFYAYEGLVRLSEQKNDEARQLFIKARELDKDNIRALLGLASYHAADNNLDDAIGLLSEFSSENGEDLQVLLFRAGLLRTSGKLDAAEKDYANILKVKPHHTQANLGMALLNLSRRNPDAVLAVLDNFSPRLQPSPIVQYLRGLSWYLKKDFDEADKYLQKVLINAPGHPQTHLLSGVINYHRQNWQVAEDHLLRASYSFQNNLEIIKLLSATYLKLQQADKAEKLLNQLLLSTVNADAQVYSLLGAVYLQQKDNNRAQEMFSRAVEMAPQQSDFKVQLAFGLLADGETDRAITELESAIDLGEEKIQTDTLLMLSYLRAGDTEKAINTGKKMQAKYNKSPLPDNLTGLAYMSVGQYKLAEKAFSSALTKDSRFEVAALNLARNSVLAGDQDKALEQFNDVLELNGENVKALLALAELSAKKGYTQQQLEYLEKVHDLQPGNIIAVTQLAEIYLRNNEPLQALSVLSDIQGNASSSPAVLRLMGIAQYEAGRYTQAINTFRQLVAAMPDNLQANFMLGRAYLQDNRLAQAKQYFSVASKADPEYQQPMLWIALGEIALKEKNIARVLDITQSLIQAGHELAAINDLRALAFQMKGQSLEALKLFEKAFTQQPNRQRLMRLAGLHTVLGNRKSAEDLLTEWVADHAEDVDTHIMLAVSLQQNGQKKEAIKVYEDILKLHADHAVVMNNLAWLYHETGDKRAFELAKMAYEKARNRPEIIDTYGWILFERGEHARALAVLQEALLLKPSHPEIAYHVAVALRKLERNEEASDLLQRIINNAPDSPYATKAGKLLGR